MIKDVPLGTTVRAPVPNGAMSCDRLIGPLDIGGLYDNQTDLDITATCRIDRSVPYVGATERDGLQQGIFSSLVEGWSVVPAARLIPCTPHPAPQFP